MITLRRRIAQKLEKGTLVPRMVGEPLGRLYGFLARETLARPVELPTNRAVVGIGGALLGGSGKTLVAIAYAKSLQQAGQRVALVSHGYGSKVSSPLRCEGWEPVEQVGDDALVAARTLAPLGIAVWVGKDRSETLCAAARQADVLVVDGLLQAKPKRVHRSVLVLDGNHPMGSGHCPPGGDLRGDFSELVGLCDEVVWVVDRKGTIPTMKMQGKLIRIGWLEVGGVWLQGRRNPLGILKNMRVGWVSWMAHPQRVLFTLKARGIHPICCWNGADHGNPKEKDIQRLRLMAREVGLDTWVVTQKCVTHMEQENWGIPLSVIEVTTHLDRTPMPVLDSPPCVPQESSSSFSRPF